MLEFYKVYKAHGEGKIWELPPRLAKKLNLKEKQFVTLKCGSLSIQTEVKINHSSIQSETNIGLSKDALMTLKIPENLSLGIKNVKTKQFQLGPLVGILTFPHVIRKKQLNRYINYAKGMKDTGLLYVFRPSDIHSDTKTITGFHYNYKKLAWESGEFPYPDVVMDRMYPNNYKAHSKLENVIGQNKIFNKKTLINKMEFNAALKKDPFLRNFLPETKQFLSVQDLENFLTKYNGVFLKPLDLMRGKGIIYVTAEKKELLCRYMDGDKPMLKKIPRADYIFEFLGQICEYKRQYIIQAAVDRMKFKERPFSFRIMTTKDGNGRWSVPIIIAKAARPGAFLTNISSGAEYVLLKDLLGWIKKQLPDKSIDLLDQLTDLSSKTATALDNEFGPLGKLGIDAVIDISGKPWLIEANGNPGLIFRRGQSEFPAWHRQMYEHPLAYALYLAGFSKSNIMSE